MKWFQQRDGNAQAIKWELPAQHFLLTTYQPLSAFEGEDTRERKKGSAEEPWLGLCQNITLDVKDEKLASQSRGVWAHESCSRQE